MSVNEALQGQYDYMYVPNLINFSKPIFRCIEGEEAMLLSVFFYCNCAFFLAVTHLCVICHHFCCPTCMLLFQGQVAFWNYTLVNVFSMKVVIEKTIFTIVYWRQDCHFMWSSKPLKGSAFGRAKTIPSFLSYFKTLFGPRNQTHHLLP